MRQAILYDANGKVWAVHDPMGDYDLPLDPRETMAMHFPGATPGCGVIHYEKYRGIGANPDGTAHELHSWQLAVDKHLGKA